MKPAAQGPSGAFRGLQGPPEPSRGLQEPPGASRRQGLRASGPPGASKNFQRLRHLQGFWASGWDLQSLLKDLQGLQARHRSAGIFRAPQPFRGLQNYPGPPALHNSLRNFQNGAPCKGCLRASKGPPKGWGPGQAFNQRGLGNGV